MMCSVCLRLELSCLLTIGAATSKLELQATLIEQHRTLTLMTLIEPTREHMPIYTKMLVVPCNGAAQNIRYSVVMTTTTK